MAKRSVKTRDAFEFVKIRNSYVRREHIEIVDDTPDGFKIRTTSGIWFCSLTDSEREKVLEVLGFQNATKQMERTL